MNIDYTGIIKRAAKIAWQNRYLWWFGLFIALAGLGNFNFSLDENSPTEKEFRQKITDFASTHEQLVISLIVIAVLVCLTILVLSIISRGGLIRSIQDILDGKENNFRLGFRAGKKNFWKLLGIGFSLGILVLLVVLVMAVPIAFLFMNQSYFIGGLLAFIAFLIFIPFIFIIIFLNAYGPLYAVLGEVGVWHSLEAAYRLIRTNLKSSFIMLLLFIPIGIAFFLIVAAIIFVLVILFAIIGLAAFFSMKSTGSTLFVIPIAALAILIALAILLTVKSAYEAFSQTVWVLFFNEIARTKVEEAVPETEKNIEKEIKPAVTPTPTMIETDKE